MGLGPNGEGLRTGSHKGAPGVVKDTHQNAHQSQTCTSLHQPAPACKHAATGQSRGVQSSPGDCCQMRVAGRGSVGSGLISGGSEKTGPGGASWSTGATDKEVSRAGLESPEPCLSEGLAARVGRSSPLVLQPASTYILPMPPSRLAPLREQTSCRCQQYIHYSFTGRPTDRALAWSLHRTAIIDAVARERFSPFSPLPPVAVIHSNTYALTRAPSLKSLAASSGGGGGHWRYTSLARHAESTC